MRLRSTVLAILLATTLHRAAQPAPQNPPSPVGPSAPQSTPPLQGAVAPQGPMVPQGQTLHVFVPPPLEWNNRTMVARPSLQQSSHDLAVMNGDVVFGMTPEQVAGQIPGIPAGLNWNTLRTAREYSSDVRYFWVRLDELPLWRAMMHSCIGSPSYAAFLFSGNGLFRISFRLLPDAACPSVTDAAVELFSHYISIGPGVALSVRYRSMQAEVVDVTDPTAASLIPVRWRMSGS
jgi:hypothetical protein